MYGLCSPKMRITMVNYCAINHPTIKLLFFELNTELIVAYIRMEAGQFTVKILFLFIHVAWYDN